ASRDYNPYGRIVTISPYKSEESAYIINRYLGPFLEFLGLYRIEHETGLAFLLRHSVEDSENVEQRRDLSRAYTTIQNPEDLGSLINPLQYVCMSELKRLKVSLPKNPLTRQLLQFFMLKCEMQIKGRFKGCSSCNIYLEEFLEFQSKLDKIHKTAPTAQTESKDHKTLREKLFKFYKGWSKNEQIQRMHEIYASILEL
ncbi:MAG: hypothetical protein AAF621_08440, partial [Pseudomonadota bacterium]